MGLRRLCRIIRNLRASVRSFLVSSSYRFVDHVRGFSYEFDKNGEKEVLETISELQFETVFDVGANIGHWSKVALGLFPKATVYAFELSQQTFSVLHSNLRGNRVRLYDFGLSDVEEAVKFKDYGVNSGGNTMVLRSSFHDDYLDFGISEGRVKVGDDFFRKEGLLSIDFLKIDVEGAEHLVLKGFSSTLEQQKVRIIQFEYGYANGDGSFLMRDFYDFLGGFGYVIARVERGGLDFRDWRYPDNDFKSGPNYVAVLGHDTEVINLLAR